jgi:hypothetical protein
MEHIFILYQAILQDVVRADGAIVRFEFAPNGEKQSDVWMSKEVAEEMIRALEAHY